MRGSKVRKSVMPLPVETSNREGRASPDRDFSLRNLRTNSASRDFRFSSAQVWQVSSLNSGGQHEDATQHFRFEKSQHLRNSNTDSILCKQKSLHLEVTPSPCLNHPWHFGMRPPMPNEKVILVDCTFRPQIATHMYNLLLQSPPRIIPSKSKKTNRFSGSLRLVAETSNPLS